MKHLKKHPKQQRMEDMTFPITKMGKKMNKIIAKAFDKKHVDTPEKGSELTLDKLEAQFKKSFDPEMDTCFICNPPRPNREHKTMGGKPVHERDEVLPNTVYMVNEDMFCLPEKQEKVTMTGRDVCVGDLKKDEEYEAYWDGVNWIIKDKVTWTGREWLRSINDDRHGWHVLAWVILGVAVIISLKIVL